MTDDPRIQPLLDLLQDFHASPEEICASCPELLPVVRERWRQMCRLRADLNVLFPLPDVPTPPLAVDTPHLRPDLKALLPPPDTLTLRPAEGAAEWPRIPGYEVEAILGRGGMGVVFRARHLRLNRLVALKMMIASGYCGPHELERFRREAEAVAALRHPNIVQVHDAGESAGRPYFTMEYVEGGSLARWLADRPSPRRAAEMAATLAAAVQFAHLHGFIHRDLKPSNILLTAAGTPKITDFGLVLSVNVGPRFTQSGDCLGTPSYMAPEQALGQASALGPAVDVYALGAVLYEILTGRPPFDGQTPLDTMQKVISEEPPPPSRLKVRVPRDLETICLKCLQKTPTRRYASAQDLADDLHRFLEGKPVLARPVGLVERAAKWARRRPARAVLIGAVLVALGVAIAAGLWLHQQAADRKAAKSRREGQAREIVETALRRADDLRREEHWPETLLILADAAPHLADANDAHLETRLREVQAAYRAAVKLQTARESNPRLSDGLIDYRQWAAEFGPAFEAAGLRIEDDVETVAAHIRASTIRTQLVATVEARAFVAFMLKDEPLVERLLRVTRLADPEPLWRDRFRDGAVWKDRARLLHLAGGAFNSTPPPAGDQLVLLALLLRQAGARSESSLLLAEACRRQPRNFLAHREMGQALALLTRWLEAAAYYRAAVTLRPDNAGAQEGYGIVLARANRTEEALTAFRRAVELSPKCAPSPTRLVEALANAGYWKDADAACRRALEIDPANYLTPLRLAEIMVRQERFADAVVLSRLAADITPIVPEAHVTLGTILARLDRHEEAATAFRKAVELKAWKLMPEILLAQELVAAGRPAEGLAVLETALGREPDHFLILLEAGKLYRSQGMSEEAADAFTRAAKVVGYRFWAWDGLAAARLDQGRFAEARAAIAPLLEMAGKPEEHRAHRRTLELCDALLPIADNLPAILAGKERPATAATLRALAEWCLKHKRLPATAAAFYEAAFAERPALADDLEAGDRLDAACAAALAGYGIGADAAALNSERRAALRQQALTSLTADYNAWAERHRLGKPGERTVAATAVRSWQRHEDLAGVRDESALAKLPDDERRTWQAIWAKVARLAASDPLAKLNQARAHVASRQWQKAAQCYAEGMELEPTEKGEVWFEFAAAQLLAGDRPGYRQTCGHVLARCQSKPQAHLSLAARTCTLAPDSTDDSAQPFRLYANGDKRSDADSWPLTEQGVVHFRAGQVAEAVPFFERSLADDGRPGRAILDWLWLALAHQKLGKLDEARRWFAKAVNWLDQQGGRMPLDSPALGSHRHNWLEAHVLRQQVEAGLR
jgi:serine/threonine-protein kinase